MKKLLMALLLLSILPVNAQYYNYYQQQQLDLQSQQVQIQQQQLQEQQREYREQQIKEQQREVQQNFNRLSYPQRNYYNPYGY